jgi:hypothetical protein
MQIVTVLVLATLITLSSGYRNDPNEYEEDSVRHIDYELDQMGIKMSGGGMKIKRMAVPDEDNDNNYQGQYDETIQTPAQDRNYVVRPKVKRMSKSGKTVHIYLNNKKQQQQQQQQQQQKPQPQLEEPQQAPQPQERSSKSFKKASGSTGRTKKVKPETQTEKIETQTRKAPELTTKADNIRNVEYVDRDRKPKDRDSATSGSSRSQLTASPIIDSATESSELLPEIIKEKIKIKHHHHHHHHNHVKTVVKKEPFAVEKIVHVPVEKIVEKVIEKKVPYKVEVEKIVHVPVEKRVPYKVSWDEGKKMGWF